MRPPLVRYYYQHAVQTQEILQIGNEPMDKDIHQKSKFTEKVCYLLIKLL